MTKSVDRKLAKAGRKLLAAIREDGGVDEMREGPVAEGLARRAPARPFRPLVDRRRRAE